MVCYMMISRHMMTDRTLFWHWCPLVRWPLPTPPNIIHQMSPSCLPPHSPSSGQFSHHLHSLIEFTTVCLVYTEFTPINQSLYLSPSSFSFKTRSYKKAEGLPSSEILMSATFYNKIIASHSQSF